MLKNTLFISYLCSYKHDKNEWFFECKPQYAACRKHVNTFHKFFKRIYFMTHSNKQVHPHF